jgi:hypothetical protein
MEKNIDEMRNMLDVMTDEDAPYESRLDAYEYLSEDCGEIVDEMLKRRYDCDGDNAKMLLEVLSNYKGNKAIYMALISELYKGEDVALFAKLIGSYGDEKAIDALKGFLAEYEPDYNEFMEIRNAIEELGGVCDYKQDFSQDPLYRYLKGLDAQDENSRKSPFDSDADGDGCADDGCGLEDGDCDCCAHGSHEEGCGCSHNLHK